MWESLFWEGVAIPEELSPAVTALGLAHTSYDEQLSAYSALLESDQVVARGLALDRYSRDSAQGRQGDNEHGVLRVIQPAIRQCALRELAAQPFENPDPGAMFSVGANHGSAFSALGFGCRPEDAALIAKALAENDDVVVLEAGARTAGAVLYRRAEIAPELALVLERMVKDRGLPSELRTEVVRAVGGSTSGIVVPWLMEALADDALDVSAAAGRQLLTRDRSTFKGAVERVALAWQLPPFPPFDVGEVFDLLGRGDA